MKSTGGGQKINLFKKEMEKYKDDREKIVLFTDRHVSSPFLKTFFKNYSKCFSRPNFSLFSVTTSYFLEK